VGHRGRFSRRTSARTFAAVLAYPVGVEMNARVDARLAPQRAQNAPAGDARQLPRPAEPGLADQRTTGVAGARVLAARLVAGAHHVVFDAMAVPGALATQRVRQHRYLHLVQHVVVSGSCVVKAFLQSRDIGIELA